MKNRTTRVVYTRRSPLWLCAATSRIYHGSSMLDSWSCWVEGKRYKLVLEFRHDVESVRQWMVMRKDGVTMHYMPIFKPMDLLTYLRLMWLLLFSKAINDETAQQESDAQAFIEGTEDGEGPDRIEA